MLTLQSSRRVRVWSSTSNEKIVVGTQNSLRVIVQADPRDIVRHVVCLSVTIAFRRFRTAHVTKPSAIRGLICPLFGHLGQESRTSGNIQVEDVTLFWTVSYFTTLYPYWSNCDLNNRIPMEKSINLQWRRKRCMQFFWFLTWLSQSGVDPGEGWRDKNFK